MLNSDGDQTPLTRVPQDKGARKQTQKGGIDLQLRDGTVKTVACRCLSILPALFGGEVCSSQAIVELGNGLARPGLAPHCACGLSRRAGRQKDALHYRQLVSLARHVPGNALPPTTLRPHPARTATFHLIPAPPKAHPLPACDGSEPRRLA